MNKKFIAYALVFALLILVSPLYSFAYYEVEQGDEVGFDEVLEDDGQEQTLESDEPESDVIPIEAPATDTNLISIDATTPEKTDDASQEHEPSENPEELENVGEDDIVNVDAPVSIDFVLDPFEVAGRGQVFSEEFIIENQGNSDVMITFADITVTFANETDFKPLSEPFAGGWGDGMKSIYLLLDFGREDIPPVVATAYSGETISIILGAPESDGTEAGSDISNNKAAVDSMDSQEVIDSEETADHEDADYYEEPLTHEADEGNGIAEGGDNAEGDFDAESYGLDEGSAETEGLVENDVSSESATYNEENEEASGATGNEENEGISEAADNGENENASEAMDNGENEDTGKILDSDAKIVSIKDEGSESDSSYLTLTISGNMNPYPFIDWADGDVKISLKYMLEAIVEPAEDESIDEEEYAQEEEYSDGNGFIDNEMETLTEPSSDELEQSEINEQELLPPLEEDEPELTETESTEPKGTKEHELTEPPPNEITISEPEPPESGWEESVEPEPELPELEPEESTEPEPPESEPEESADTEPPEPEPEESSGNGSETLDEQEDLDLDLDPDPDSDGLIETEQ